MTQNTSNPYAELFSRHQETAQKLKTAPIEHRKKKLRAMKRWIFQNRQVLQEAVFEDLHKPAAELDVTEIYPLLAELRHAIHRVKRWAAPKPVEGGIAFLGTYSYIQTEPLGSSLIIAPWNYPLLLTLGPLVSAVAAGNTALIKPSEMSAATSAIVAKMVSELFDPNEICVIEGEVETTTHLLALPFDHIFFTGSPAIGKIVMAAAAKNLSAVTLELGGKSPTVVDETADVHDAARKISWGKWTNAGQTCVAPDYLFVHVTKKEQFLECLENELMHRYDDVCDYANIINEKHENRLQDLLADAVSKGAKVYEPLELAGRMSPKLVLEVSDEMRLMQEEIFGPVLPIMVYENLNEVIEYINDRPKPLALYHFTTSRKKRNKMLETTSSGTAVINDNVLHFGHPHLQVGGVNTSGLGKAHGEAGFRAFSHEKSVLRQRRGYTVARMVYPPYNSFKIKLIDLLLKYF